MEVTSRALIVNTAQKNGQGWENANETMLENIITLKKLGKEVWTEKGGIREVCGARKSWEDGVSVTRE